MESRRQNLPQVLLSLLLAVAFATGEERARSAAEKGVGTPRTQPSHGAAPDTDVPRRIVEFHRVVEPQTADARKVDLSQPRETVWVAKDPILTSKEEFSFHVARRSDKDGVPCVEMELGSSERAKEFESLARSGEGARLVAFEDGQPIGSATLSGLARKGRVRLRVPDKDAAISLTSALARSRGWCHLGGELWGSLSRVGEDRPYYGRNISVHVGFLQAGPEFVSIPSECVRRRDFALLSGLELELTGPDGQTVGPFNKARFRSTAAENGLSAERRDRYLCPELYDGFSLPLDRWYEFKKAGTYRFRVRFTKALCGFAEGETNTVAFEVLDDAAGSAGELGVKIAPEGRFRLGEPMRLKVKITNQSALRVHFEDEPLGTSHLPAQLEVHRVGVTPEERVPHWSEGGLGCLIWLSLQPGESVEESFDIGDVCCIRQAGSYRVRVTVAQSSGAVVTVRVTGPARNPVGVDIQGTVVRPDGTAAAGTVVRLSEGWRTNVAFEPRPPLCLVGRTRADEEGRYRFSRLRGDSPWYAVEFYHQDFAWARKEIETRPEQGEYVVDARLDSGRTVEGVVKDESGKPIEGVEVKARQQGASRATLMLAPELEKRCRTDARGRFSIRGLPDQGVEWEFTKEDYIPSGDAPPFPGPWEITLKRPIIPRHQSQGTVSFRSGKPWGDYRLEFLLQDQTGSPVNAWCSDIQEDGRFTVRLPGTGPYFGHVAAESPGGEITTGPYLAIVQNVRAGATDLKVTFDDTGSLRVKVTSLTRLRDDVSIRIACIRKPPEIPGFGDEHRPVTRAELPSAGGVALLTASPGPCEIVVTIPGSDWSERRFTRSTEITSGLVRDIEIVLPEVQFGTVTGRVVYSGRSGHHKASVIIYHTLGSTHAETGLDGRFISDRIPAGAVTICVDDRTSAGAIVKPGELTDVGRIALPGVGRIEGTVVYDDGTPVLDATIGSRYGQTVGRGGEFRQEFLSGKRSVVACCGPLGGDGLPSHYVIRDVRVRAGRTTRTKLVVPSQRGTVVEGQLTGIPGQRMTLVVFTSPDERWACASRVTNEGGFSVRPVPRGDAVLVFYAGYAGYGQPTSYFGYREMKIAGTPAKIAVDGLDVSTVRGTVSWPEGDAIAAIPVRLVPRPLFGRLLREGSQSPHGWFALSVFEDAHQSGTTDANGGFCFGNVGPGEYVLTAYPQGSPKFSTPVKVPGRGKTLMVEMRKPRR